MGSISRRKFVKIAGVAGASIALGGLAGCSSAQSHSESASTVANTVVYGKIYTSNASNDYAQAVAIKDGKYIFVGSEDGVEEFIKEGSTTIVDHRDKGLVMAGATEGHGHYVAAGLLGKLGLSVAGSTEEEIVANVKKYVENNPDKSVYYTYGWDNVAMINTKATIDMKSQLDAICADRVMFIVDNTGHNAFCNSKAFEVAGITSNTEIVGGEFAKNENGELLGLASDMAMNYVLKKAVAIQTIVQEADYDGIAQAMEESLHACGYTYYQDGWTNYFGTQLLEALSSYDKKTGLALMAVGSYKIDSYDDWETEITKAEECMKSYSSDHFKCNAIKLFADGEAVESKSGWMLEGYVDGTHGTQVWETDVMNSIVKAANEVGLSVHVHAQGDGAIQQVVDAYINAESVKKDGVYNGICHGRNYLEEAKKKMGEHNIYAAENINWRALVPKENLSSALEFLTQEQLDSGYPIKSLLENGVNVSSSTDYPASSGAPTTVCGIMEIAVNDTRPDIETYQHDKSEEVSIEEAMNIMTINGAKQLMIDAERGSIEVGKYADFVLYDKDITTCEKTKINEGKPIAVYFEGNQVYSA